MSEKEKKDDLEEGYPLAGEHGLFVGHELVVDQLRRSFERGRFHHAWLLEGMKGVGKATLAWRVARFLLARGVLARESIDETTDFSVSQDSEVWHLTLAMSHPDFLVISPSPEQKTATITVDDIRRVNQFFTKSAAFGGRRVCIIDAVDNMNLNAANALLKILEEPPDNAIFFLISHRAGTVLPTIRSRCYHLPFAPLAREEIEKIIKAFFPRLGRLELETAITLGGGSAGRALSFASGEGRQLYRDLRKLIGGLSHRKPYFDIDSTEKFCVKCADDERYDLFCVLILRWVHAITLQSEYHRLGFGLWRRITDLMRDQKYFNIDQKQTARHIFLCLEEAYLGETRPGEAYLEEARLGEAFYN